MDICVQYIEHLLSSRAENITKKYFMQAMSQPDMKEWLEVMEGREPVRIVLFLLANIVYII